MPKIKDMTTQEIATTYVEEITDSNTRRSIFAGYTNYNSDMSERISENRIQWISGSFVTQKTDPEDIDVVNFVPASKLHTETQIEKAKAFRTKHGSKDRYGVDGYIIPVFPPDHPARELTEEYTAYWLDRFGKYYEGEKRTIVKVDFPEGGAANEKA